MENQQPKTVKIQLYITRHGQTEQNKNRVICGQNPGKLTKQGIEQAQKIGEHFKNQNFHKIYVSDLGRTRQTFQNISLKAPHLKTSQIKYESLIRQKHGGVLTGQALSTWDKEAQKEKKDIREYKCKDGQSWVDVHNRVLRFIEMLILENILHKQNPLPQQEILVVCHGGYIMEFHNAVRVISSRGKEKPVFTNSAKNCSIHVFELEYPVHHQAKGYNQDLLNIKCTVNNFTKHMEK